jgi:pimeloyl-ACP methyl ester carboxylesterase
VRLNGERRRDNQQWLLDWLVKTTGRVQNFAYDQRLFPPEVKSYRMIPRTLEKRARHIEEIARAAEKAGHFETARELYWHAADLYREGQHVIFEDDNPEKIYLHSKLLDCFDKVIEYAVNPIERVEIPYGDQFIQGLLYLVPGRAPAPTVLFCPGMDMTKEKFFDPFNHPFITRGLHCLHIDGPGQGTSNIRKIRVTPDNYEAAASAAIDYLLNRPEVDGQRIGVSGYSMGSYWGMRVAATDSRVRAVATGAACYGPMHAIFEEASPRFKQMFMYMAGIHDEEQFDNMAAQMTLDSLAQKIACPTLQVVGEYDPLAHLEDVLSIFRKVTGPKELWIVENDFHMPAFTENFGEIDFFGYLADWLRDALTKGKPEDLDRIVLVPQKQGLGPYSSEMSGVYLPARLNIPEAGLTPSQVGPVHRDDQVPADRFASQGS